MNNNFFEVLRPGINTTFQDKGRFGMQHLGVAPSGCMDYKSFLIANSLVSNNENEGVLEFAYQGPLLKLIKGKTKLKNYKNIKWLIAAAENLPIIKNSFDYYTISFGLRNTKNLNKSFSEAYRVLKPGGRYLCLEFSKIKNSNLNFIYKNYSKLMPLIGKIIVGEKKPYEYLTESIKKFPNQNQVIDLMKKNKFKNCTYRNLSGGIVAIHSGWKI